MASESNRISAADLPGASRIRDLAGTVVETLRAAQGQIRAESADLRTQREQLTKEREQLLKSQADLTQVHKEVETKFAELAQASSNINQLRAEIESAREELDSERIALCGERVRQFSPGTETPEVAVSREQVLINNDRAAAQLSSHRSREPEPKPASNDAALQFRKLRRDAKRKAVGV